MKWCSDEDIVKVQATIDEYQTLWKDINERLTKIKLPVEDESVKTIVQVRTFVNLQFFFFYYFPYYVIPCC